MTREQLFAFFNNLQRFPEVKNTKFNYALLKNSRKIQEEIDIINKVAVHSKEFIDYENARVAACLELAEKNEDGTPKVENGRYVFSEENQVAIEAKLDELKETHKVGLADHEEKQKKIRELLSETIEFTIHKVSINELPEDLDVKALEGISLMIQE